MTTLTLIRPNLHRVDSAGRQMLFHVPSSSLFELDGAARDVLALFDEHATLEAASLVERLGGRHDALAVRETVDELRQLQVLVEDGEDGRINPPNSAGTMRMETRWAGHRYFMAFSRIMFRYLARNASEVDSGSISPPPIMTNCGSSAIASVAMCRPIALA